MKKLAFKLRSKKQPKEPEGRITNDTLAEHRERVLAGGRKFKYPVQYQRHKLVINASIVAAAVILLLISLGWYLLYVAQNTSEFMYRVTRVVPVPVAVVDGQHVRYSDYLMKYRGAAHYLIEKERVDVNTSDGKAQLAFVKQQAMDDAVSDAYAAKLAKELDVTVSDAELEALLKEQRQSSDDGEIKVSTHNSVLEEFYGWSIGEYREVMKGKLLKQKVSYALDANAEKVANSAETKIKAGNTDLEKVAAELNETDDKVAEFWGATWVPKNNQDGGVAATAAKLEKGQISSAIKTSIGDSGHFYVFVKLLDSNDTQVQYEYIRIPLKQFSAQLNQAKDEGKLRTFIELKNINERE